MFLVLNVGSSSIKYKVFTKKGKEFDVIAKGVVEKIGLEDGIFSLEYFKNKKTLNLKIENHELGVDLVFKHLIENKIISSPKDIKAIGHRIVHGGTKFQKPTIITKAVISELDKLSSIAPLHNPPALKVINYCSKKTDVKNIAVFDTSFHTSIPKQNYLYGIKKEWTEKLHIKRYGFHGINVEYVFKKAASTLKLKPNNTNAIVCHLGNGASVTAIKNGKSFNTSMGFTPSEGLLMGTRAGDLDFMIIEYVAKQLKTDVSTVIKQLNSESGLKGVSALTSDMRDVIAGYEKKNPDAVNALELFVKQVVKYISWYTNQLEGKVDLLILTGAIGENAILIREKIFKSLFVLPIQIDYTKNNQRSPEVFEISKKGSKTKVLSVPGDEELMIVQELFKLI